MSKPQLANGKSEFTVAEVAQILGCHPQTVRAEIRKGNLKAFRRLGNRRGYLISRDVLLEALQEG